MKAITFRSAFWVLSVDPSICRVHSKDNWSSSVSKCSRTSSFRSLVLPFLAHGLSF